MKAKLVYHPQGPLEWGVAIHIGHTARWIEQAQFLLRMDALKSLKNANEYGRPL